MSTKAAGLKADIESKQAMSTKAPDSKHDMSTACTKIDIESKHDMAAKDVSVVTDRYLSTDFVVSDAEGNCSAQFSQTKRRSHLFNKKNFVVKPNKEEYRILKNDAFMLEFDGSTTIRKAFVKAEGFVRYPFQLVDFDSIEPTNNKYLIDVADYVTNVGRTTYQKSGSVNLDFYLVNHRYRLELDVSDNTAHVVVIMFDELTTSLVKWSVESIVEAEDEVNPAEGVEDNVGSSTLDAVADTQAPKLKRLAQHPSVPTPLKPSDERKKKRVDIEDSDTKASGDSAKGANKDRVARVSDKKKRSVVIEDSDIEVSRGSTKGTKTRVAVSLIRKKEVDRRVQSYCGLKVADIPAANSGPAHVCAAKKTTKGAALTSAGVPAAYHNLGPPSYQCSSYHATMWYDERNDKARRAINPTFSICCQEGKVLLSRFNETPLPLKKLLDYNDPTTSRFKD
ncbi:hypothetical protein Tco_1429410 [Tanacetum coccineum]